MAKLHGAAKAKFLARMARGRKKAGRRSRRVNPKRRGKARRKNPLYARHGIDRNERIYPSMVKRTPNPRRRRKARKSNRKRARARRHNPIAYLVNPSGGKSMARKRRRKHSRKSNPRRRRHSRARRHNPRRRRHARRRNPGLKLNIKSMIMPAGAALAGGFVGGLVEAKTSHMNPMISKALQVVAGIGGGLLATKFSKNATAGAAFTGAILGGLTRRMGEKVGGGVASIENMQHIAELASSEENYGLLLQQNMNGMGLILAPMNGGLGDDSGSQMDSALAAAMGSDEDNA